MNEVEIMRYLKNLKKRHILIKVFPRVSLIIKFGYCVFNGEDILLCQDNLNPKEVSVINADGREVNKIGKEFDIAIEDMIYFGQSNLGMKFLEKPLKRNRSNSSLINKHRECIMKFKGNSREYYAAYRLTLTD